MITSSEIILQMKNVNLWYDKGKPAETWALRKINMEIKKGEYVAFFGPSGCGKTTLLYTLAGIEQPQEGGVLIIGKDITHLSKRELAIYRQVGVGIVFQQFNLIPSITVLDNVALPLSFLGMGISLKRRHEEATRLLDRLGIKDLAERHPYELSGGQQQRVGIARALANNPPIIVADEPLGNLDSENANKVLEFLKELNAKDGRTIIMVTHEAWSMRDCKRVFYMRDGSIIKVETPRAPAETAKSALATYLYKELHPELSSNEAIAKSLAHLLLRGYSIEEVKRFEFFLKQRFNNQIDNDLFATLLDKPFKDGGVGLWRTKVEKITKWTEDIIKQKKGLEAVEKELADNPLSSVQGEVDRIRAWLLSEYKGKINDIQRLRLDEIIGERVRKIISSADFRKILSLSKSKFGVGLSYRAAQRLAEKIDTIMGVDAAQKLTEETI
ncbi:MAG: ABC transporter ATP-binding protein [Candidatus Magasanikbacteria bacterium]|nr:ABC transporter ATP-binding protein [Candidatus Magasanikbacteria bacterium]